MDYNNTYLDLIMVNLYASFMLERCILCVLAVSE